MEKIKMKKESS